MFTHSPSNLYTFILENIFRKYFIEDLFAIRWRTYELSPWTLKKSPYLDKLFSLTNVIALNCSEIIFMKYLLVVKIVIQLCVVRIHKYFLSSRKSKLLHQWPKEERRPFSVDGTAIKGKVSSRKNRIEVPHFSTSVLQFAKRSCRQWGRG